MPASLVVAIECPQHTVAMAKDMQNILYEEILCTLGVISH